VNLILFELKETQRPLPLDDRRARHILEVLKRKPGEDFEAGLIDGPRGKSVLEAIDETALHLRFVWGPEPPALEPITLIVGLPRPQTARKVLEEATALGVSAMHFFCSELGERSYSQSKLWNSDEWRRHLNAGAEQAFSTRLPVVTWDRTLAAVTDGIAANGTRIALDNYGSPERLGALTVTAPVTLVLGPERGWSASERDLLREAGFHFAHLGERVLRVETACVAAITIARAGLGSL